MLKRKVLLAALLGLSMLLLCSTALACPNPDPCPGNTYDIEYAKEAYHLLVCTLCGYKTAYSHSGGTATCTQKAICGACGHEYGDEPIGYHDWGEYIPDGNATCMADGTKTAKCKRCIATDTVADVGSAGIHSFTNYVSDGNATCTVDGTKTAKCDYGCGTTDTVTDAGSALGHSFTKFTSDGNATCTTDGTKTAYCIYGCGFAIAFPDVGSALGHDSRYSICPVCGELNGTTVSAFQATVTNADDDVGGIPRLGRLNVHGMETPFNGVLYALSIPYEVAKEDYGFTGMVHVEIPLELADELPEFRLVHVDVTEGEGEDAELTEVWTEIECRYEDGVLSFDTDAGGMFLLLPVA